MGFFVNIEGFCVFLVFLGVGYDLIEVFKLRFFKNFIFNKFFVFIILDFYKFLLNY